MKRSSSSAAPYHSGLPTSMPSSSDSRVGECLPFPGRDESKAKDKKSIESPDQLACLHTESLGGDLGLVSRGKEIMG